MPDVFTVFLNKDDDDERGGVKRKLRPAPPPTSIFFALATTSIGNALLHRPCFGYSSFLFISFKVKYKCHVSYISRA